LALFPKNKNKEVMKMRIKIDSALFTNAIKLVSTLVDEVELKVTPEQLELIEFDNPNVAMVILKIPSSSCLEWQVDKDESMGLRLKDMVPMLKRARKGTYMDLETTEGKLSIKMDNNRTFQLGLLDLDREKPKKEPELKPEVSLQIPTKEVADALEDVSVVADGVTLKTTTGHLFMSGDQDNTYQVNVDIPIGSLIVTNETKCKYAVDYLTRMIKPSIDENVTLEFSKDYPIRITYNTKSYYIRWILAPRVES